MEKCEECGMLLEEKTTCTCQPHLCIHCCKCGADCECGCKDKE